MQEEFYEEIEVELRLKARISSGELNRKLKEAGARLFYDVYGFERQDEVPAWQSDCFMDVMLFIDGAEVDAQDGADRIVLSYPLASIGAEYISIFAEKIQLLAHLFEAEIYLENQLATKLEIVSYCDKCVSEIFDSWGEEPGSESLVIYIESNYGKR